MGTDTVETSELLLLEAGTRAKLWRRVVEAVEGYARGVGALRVARRSAPAELRAGLAPFDFDSPAGAEAALDFTLGTLLRHQTHTAHPRYFGLFDPAPTTMGILAETLAAAFNPQLSVWSHSPAAAEIEQHLVRAFSEKFGYDGASADGTFTSGGAEANHTALLAALTHAFPDFARGGVRALAGRPVLYVSAEGHHSVLKAARLCGLGTEAVREIETDARLRMKADVLSARIARDRAEGLLPFLVAATAGTTSAGAIDPLARLADVAAREGLWLHVDAAWGGAAAIVPELRHLLGGINRADSITFDPHKWLSVPRGAGMFLTRHRRVLAEAFGVPASYMPRAESSSWEVVDQFGHSMQWSRRFSGLKVFLSLAVAGWDGYAASIRHQVSMGDLLRRELAAAGWELVNDSPLPVVCFADGSQPPAGAAEYLKAVAREVVAAGRAWISVTRLGGDRRPALRACVTNYRTGPEDVRALVGELRDARGRIAAGAHTRKP